MTPCAIQILGDAVDAASLAQRRQVDAHAGRLRARWFAEVDLDATPADARTRRVDGGGVRHLRVAGSGPKPQRFTSGPTVTS